MPLLIEYRFFFSLVYLRQTDMDGPSPSPPSSPVPTGHYDIRHMCEEDFEKLAVYMVPDVPCERGTAMRAQKTLPRSLTLKPSLVMSAPNEKVRTPTASARSARRTC